MAEKKLIKGNYAIAQAAINAGLEGYFGYPITPQSEIGEYLSKELPKIGKVHVNAESELAAINMVLGGVSTGKKVMTSSSSCAIALMQETLAAATSDEMPVVLVSVMRAGPGLGYIYPAQGDYNQALIGGGNGDYRTIVLAPSTVQECVDLTYKAFYLAFKYKNPTILLADGLLGQMMEPVEFEPYPYEDIDTSSWELGEKKDREQRVIKAIEADEDKLCKHIKKMFEKYALLEENEVEFEEYMVEDADLILMSFGSLSRSVKAAVKLAREKGLKVGFFRPITLFPFPNKRIKELAEKTNKILVCEMNQGQMLRDVKLAVNGLCDVEFFGKPVGKFLYTEDFSEKIEEVFCVRA